MFCGRVYHGGCTMIPPYPPCIDAPANPKNRKYCPYAGDCPVYKSPGCIFAESPNAAKGDQP
jgi:hypothetical protein